jgi:protein-S-isoprenylcysteine O-methyltransferase Ste14
MFALPVGLPGLIALALGILAFFASLFVAGRRRAGEQGSRRDGGSWGWIALQGIAIGFAGFGPIHVALAPFSAVALAQATGVALLIGGAVALFVWASRTMGAEWAIVARTRADARLVTAGPFAYVRNPIYVALGLFMVAMALAYGHPGQLLLAVPLYAFATSRRVHSEEKLLLAAFGADYADYRARVPRFVPRLA